ncbi:MAG TPA: 6-carboxytetrahydropterin synthase [Candidatus Kapabacteria bacterium]|nr:6-carboxytetrahydropterin synthase [Candidatus Kapabacteria bacterium]
MIKIGKEYRWEMSHRLQFYDGLCKNIHGHSYKMIIELEGEADKNGIVLDFFKIDEIVEPILKVYDHCFAINRNDSEMRDFLINNNFKVVELDFNTTSENLAKHFANLLKGDFSQFANLSFLTVKVYETIDAYAEVKINLRN